MAIVPKKIQKLAQLNSLISNEPWLIKKEHFQQLLSKNEKSGQFSSEWTNSSELLNAILILLHYQKLAMIINNLDFEFYTGTDKLDLIKDNISKLSKISDKALYKVNYLKRALKEIIQNDNDINDDDDCEMLEVNDLNNIHKLSLNEDSEILNFTNGKIG